MKAMILSLTLAACAFAVVACKPKAGTTEEKVSAEADKVAEGVSNIVEIGVDEVEPTTETALPEAPAAP